MIEGAKLKRLREDMAFSREEWAALLGVHVSAIYRWETATRTVAVEGLHARILRAALKWPRKMRAQMGANVREHLALSPLNGLASLLQHISYLDTQ